MSKKTVIFSQDYANQKQKTFGLIVDGMVNISSVFLFASKRKEIDLVSAKLDEVRDHDKTRLKYIFIMHLIMAFIYMTLTIGTLFLMIYLKQKNLVTVGDFAMAFGLVFYIIEVTFHMVGELQNLIKDYGELKESFSIFSDVHQVNDKIEAKELMVKNGSIEFKDLSFVYEKQKIIFDKLNLSIKAGEKIGLVGHSGAGKSTLISALLRYFEVKSGSILIDGQNISDVTADSLRKNISVIPQDISLFHRSLLENIGYGNENASYEDVIAASKKAHIDEFVNQLPDKYKTLVGERGIKLSGGQRQRIAIARAILKDAPILILDEATSSLDSETEKYIQESLDILISDQNKTVIAVAHRLSTLKNMDRIIVLDKGKIIEEGTHEQLISRPDSYYKKLWDLQKI
jgi:ATP-binding cassette subfamily B protein